MTVLVYVLLFIFSEVLRELREEADKYGRVSEVKAANGHAFVEFQEASDCQKACTGLTGKTFDEKTVVAVFYPNHMWTAFNNKKISA